jgi:hypothetical protein
MKNQISNVENPSGASILYSFRRFFWSYIFISIGGPPRYIYAAQNSRILSRRTPYTLKILPFAQSSSSNNLPTFSLHFFLPFPADYKKDSQTRQYWDGLLSALNLGINIYLKDNPQTNILEANVTSVVFETQDDEITFLESLISDRTNLTNAFAGFLGKTLSAYNFFDIY